MMTNKKLILGLSGEIGCGKGTFADYVVKKYNGESFRFSTILRDILNRLYLPQTRENLQDISTVLRQKFGQDLLAITITKDVEKCTKSIIVVDGIRRQEDIKFLKELPKFILIYIEADPENRFKRILQRSENPDDAIKTFDQFKKELEKESEIKIKELKNVADYIINNNSSLTDFYSQIDGVIKKYI